MFFTILTKRVVSFCWEFHNSNAISYDVDDDNDVEDDVMLRLVMMLAIMTRMVIVMMIMTKMMLVMVMMMH